MPEEKDPILQRVDSLEKGHGVLSNQITKLTDSVGTMKDSLDTHQRATEKHLSQQDYTTGTLRDAIGQTGTEVTRVSKILLGDIIDGRPGLHQTVQDIKRIVESQTSEASEVKRDKRKEAGDFRVGVYIGVVTSILGVCGAIVVGIVLYYLHIRP